MKEATLNLPELKSEVKSDIEKAIIPAFSWDYENYSEADYWFSLAWTYLNCSSRIFFELVNSSLHTFHYSLVAAHLFKHALELFLKGAILQAGRKPTGTHDNQKLLKEYRGVYPAKNFRFNGTWIWLVSPVTGKKSTCGEFTRYPCSKSLKIWAGNWHLDLAKCCRQTGLYKDDFKRLIPLIKEKYSAKT